MLKVLQHQLCMHVTLMWCISDMRSHSCYGRSRTASHGDDTGIARAAEERVRQAVHSFFDLLHRRAKLPVLSVTSLGKGQDGSPSRIAYLMTFEPSNDGRSKPPEDSLRRPPSPLIEDLKVSIAKKKLVRPLSLGAQPSVRSVQLCFQ